MRLFVTQYGQRHQQRQAVQCKRGNLPGGKIGAVAPFRSAHPCGEGSSVSDTDLTSELSYARATQKIRRTGQRVNTQKYLVVQFHHQG